MQEIIVLAPLLISVILIFIGYRNLKNSHVKKNFDFEKGYIITAPKIEKPIAPSQPHKTPEFSDNGVKTKQLFDIDQWKNETIDHLNKRFSLSDLLIMKEIAEITYVDLLSCFEWWYKRLTILLRDAYKCNCCGERKESNHVHHNYYIQDELPWEIDDSGLETLCRDCHIERHKNVKIDVYAKSRGGLVKVSEIKQECTRCGGIGYIPGYAHVENGICFKCRGNSVSKRVFQDVLISNYNNLNNYRDEDKRKISSKYIISLSQEQILKCVPEIDKYLIRQEPDDLYEEEDLPF